MEILYTHALYEYTHAQHNHTERKLAVTLTIVITNSKRRLTIYTVFYYKYKHIYVR